MVIRENAFADLAQWCVAQRLVERHRAMFGKSPRFFPPVSFNEHIVHRIIYDRDPRLKVICDKVALRQFVQDKVGSKYIVPILQLCEHPKEIDWQTLPEKFVLKPSHSSGLVGVLDKSWNKDLVRKVAERWLSQDYFDLS